MVKRFVSVQLNVNTLISAMSLAVLVYLGHTIMDDHDVTTAHTVTLDGLVADVKVIKDNQDRYAIKAEVEAQQAALWHAVQEIRPTASPKGASAMP